MGTSEGDDRHEQRDERRDGKRHPHVHIADQMLRTGAEHGGVQNADNPHKGKYAKIRESQVATLRQIPRDADAPLGKFHALSLIGEQQSREAHRCNRRTVGPEVIGGGH